LQGITAGVHFIGRNRCLYWTPVATVLTVPPMDEDRSRLGERIRALRQRHGLSISAVARATELSKTSISTIEAGTGNPSLETLWRIANALGVTLGALFEKSTEATVTVVRRSAGPSFVSRSGVRGRLISPAGAQRRTEVLEITFDRAATYASEPHGPGTEELLICTEGEITTGPSSSPVLVGEGDAVTFTADVAHRYSSDGPARAIIVMTYPLSNSATVTREPGTHLAI